MTLEERIEKRKQELAVQRREQERIIQLEKIDEFENGKKETEDLIVSYFTGEVDKKTAEVILSRCEKYGINLSKNQINKLIRDLEHAPNAGSLTYECLSNAYSRIGNQERSEHYRRVMEDSKWGSCF